MPIVAEETIPAEADCGLRRISVTFEGGSRISMQVMQEKELEIEGEIQPGGICLSREVVTNEQITHALLHIVTQTVRFPHLQSLPDDSDCWKAKP